MYITCFNTVTLLIIYYTTSYYITHIQLFESLQFSQPTRGVVLIRSRATSIEFSVGDLNSTSVMETNVVEIWLIVCYCMVC